jgi:hypothetical protein
MSILKSLGLVEDKPNKKDSQPQQQAAPTPTTPVYFPVNQGAQPTPSYVQPVGNHSYQPQPQQLELDPKFIAVFEDELAKANKEGFDYFEFRQALLKTQQKMQSLPLNTIIQVVLTTVSVTPATLVNEANDYKKILVGFADSWVREAEQQKGKKIQEREGILANHQHRISQIDARLQELEAQRQQLINERSTIQLQMETDKGLGIEQIQKLDIAKDKMKIARDYMVGTIDKDIQALQTVQH